MPTLTYPLKEDSVTVSITTNLEQYTATVPSLTDTAAQTFRQDVNINETNSFENIKFKTDSDATAITTVELENGYDVRLGFLTNTGAADMIVTSGNPDYTDSNPTFTTIASVLIRIVLVELLNLTVENSKNYIDIIDGYSSNISTINSSINTTLATLFADAHTDFTDNDDTEIQLNGIENTISNELAKNFLNAQIYFIAEYNKARAAANQSTIYSATDINSTNGESLQNILSEIIGNGYTLVLPIMLTISGITLDGVSSTAVNCQINYTLVDE